MRDPGADGRQQLQERLGTAEAPHPAQQAGGRVLEGEVEVGHDALGRGHHVDQRRAHLGRLQVADPQPVHTVDRGQLRQQRLQQLQVAEVLAVGGGVLRDQDQLAHALAGQPAGLVEDVVRAAGQVGAAEGRDGAERAAAVAAGGQLQRGRGAVVEPAAHDPAGRRGDRGQGRVVGDLGDRGPAGRGSSGRIGDSGGVAMAGHRHAALGRLPVHRRQRQQRAAVARDVRGGTLAVQDRGQPRR